MNMRESSIEKSQPQLREGAERRVAEAETAIERLRQGGDFALPTSKEMWGSKSYWGKLTQGMADLFGPNHAVAKEAERIFDVFDNGGSARPDTLTLFVIQINKAQKERVGLKKVA